MGALTKELKTKQCSIICYEIDNDLKIYLNALEDNKLKVIYIDDIQDITYHNLFIVGNLPYYITTPIIKYLINLDLDITEMVFMVQNEVANRFTAKPNSKDYGSITLYLQYYFNVQKLFKVNRQSFNPVPKVESAIIRFSKRTNKLDVSKDKYFKLINDSFKMKRKTLKNNLSNYDFKLISRILNKYGLDENVRAEALNEEIFVEIANNI